ncbi:histidinol-phosphate transaminase [Limibacter armeniacum]|uniref:histidinol-phosphate transaminase n=1 Tax=Limibacter armeniacum TaxID=466084 RepID=UPI002FE62D10
MFEIKKILRPHIANLTPYSSARDEYTGTEGIFLDANENPIGSVAGGNFNRYPDPYQQEVKQALSNIKGVAPSQIFLGNGSDEAIDLLYRAFCIPLKDNVIIMPPTYGMYAVSAEINTTEIRKVPLTSDYQLQPEKILEATDSNTKIIFVCSPNNPTGNSLHQADIEFLLKNFDGLVVVDEAYIDFSSETSWTNRLADFQNLIILQTFSKAWGLAGLRLGMAFASEEIIQVLNKIKPPYNINQLTQEHALKALANVSEKEEMVKELLAERKRVSEKLSALGSVKHIYPSDANFILVKIDEANAVYDALIKDKIIVRNRSSVTLCDSCLRITIGTTAENDTFLDALVKICNKTMA